MTHISEEDLVLLYYRDPAADPHLRSHLRECAQCAAAAQALARDLSRCNDWAVPEPEPEFERTAWARLAPHLTEPRSRFFPRLRWAGAVAAMAVLLIAAFIAGRATRLPRASLTAGLTAGLSPQARERILAISLADHLDRAQLMLTEISHTSTSDEPDPGGGAGQRLRAQDLVEEGRLMRQTLAREGDASTLILLDEVERFMLEIANSPEHITSVESRHLRERIGSGSLLFKVRIAESNLRNEGQKL